MSKTESPAQRFVIRGALNLDSAAAHWLRWLNEGRSATLIDLGECSDIDSTGLACLRCMQASAQRTGRVLAWSHLPERLQSLCSAHRVELPGDQRSVS